MSLLGFCKITSYVSPLKKTESDFKHHVSISNEMIDNLSNLIIFENWGHHNKLLTQYLNIQWKLQSINKQIKLCQYNKNRKIITFHTHLKFNDSNKYLYIIAFENTDKELF